MNANPPTELSTQAVGCRQGFSNSMKHNTNLEGEEFLARSTGCRASKQRGLSRSTIARVTGLGIKIKIKGRILLWIGGIWVLIQSTSVIVVCRHSAASQQERSKFITIIVSLLITLCLKSGNQSKCRGA